MPVIEELKKAWKLEINTTTRYYAIPVSMRRIATRSAHSLATELSCLSWSAVLHNTIASEKHEEDVRRRYEMNSQTTRRSRSAPIPIHVSDYIVKEVLKHEKVLIQGGSTRMLISNEERRKRWERISVKVFMKFKVSLTPSQIQVHFNNRKKRVLGLHPLEKGYRLHAGSGKQLEVDTSDPIVHFQGADLGLYNYFRGRESHRARSPTGEICGQSLQNNSNGPSPLFEAPVSSDSLSDCSINAEFGQSDKEKAASSTRRETLHSVLHSEHSQMGEPLLPASSSRVDNLEAGASSSDEGEYMETLNYHHVTKLHLRRLKARMLKKQIKLFDGWTNMIEVQTRTLETLLDVAKSIRMEFDLFRKASSTVNNLSVNHLPSAPASLPQEVVRNPQMVPKCEPGGSSVH